MPGRALRVLESSIWNVLALFFCVDDVHCCETLFACFGRQSACVLTIPRSSNPLAGVLFCLLEGHYLRAGKGTLLARRKVVQEAAVHLRQSGAFRSVTVVAILDRVLDSLVRQNLRVLD